MNAVALALEPGQPRGRRSIVLAIVAALAVGLATVLVLRGFDNSPPAPGSPVVASVAQVRELSASVGHDVYWAGRPAAGVELELTHQADGRIYVRYLSDGGTVGDARPRFTTVGTYPVPAAFAALRRESRQPDAISRSLPAGGLAYMSADSPTSVYLAWPGSGYEVEVFDPSPKHALDLVLSGAIAPVR